MYTVFVDDNYHYQDETARYKLGEYEEYETAVYAAQKIVDDYLQSAYKQGMTAADLWENYCMFGEDPFIVSAEEQTRFSAWEYAADRCQQLCQ